MRSDSATIQRCGCGPVAALNCVFYLKQRRDHTEGIPLPLPYYNEKLRQVCRNYFPLVPPFGINGIVFVLGLNRMLDAEGLPFRAHWCVSGDKLWDRVAEMLERDLPVILSVGPNFPAVWEKHKLKFYRKITDGNYRPAAATKAHYVTATALDAEWLRISSWGKEYYINREEYEAFVKAHSSYLFSNLVYLSKK